jgi:glycosyltransferase involved in cell wall biosynthesis
MPELLQVHRGGCVRLSACSERVAANAPSGRYESVVRIGLLAPPWAPIPPPAYGAIETQVHSLAREISAAGHEVLLLATGDSTCPVPRRTTLIEADGRDRAVSSEVLNVVLAYDALGDVDIVHDHTLAGPLYGHQRGSTVVTTAHWVLEGRIGQLYQRMSTEIAVVAVSAAQRESMQTMRFAGTIHHGVDVSDFPMGAGTGGYCAVLGRMSPDKGIHIAIEATPILRLP